jgi:hypothetical protein
MTALSKCYSDYGVTRDLFLKWRAPRFGESNPTLMTNKVWEWLIRTKLDAYFTTEQFGGPSPASAGPTWCFSRDGQSETRMPDGRMIWIGGEHEDFCDPDFYIYNDVVVKGKDGTLSIYGYPKECFPPTDFHSATLISTKIIIIGNIGYVNQREARTTQVFVLDTGSYEIRRIDTKGEYPGWISEHKARLSHDRKVIFINGGQLVRGRGNMRVENIDDWKLNLTDWTWECVKRRNWSRCEIKRVDRKHVHLWEIRRALESLTAGRDDDYYQSMSCFYANHGYEPEVRLLEDIYNPDMVHASVPGVEDEFQTNRILVDGVIVRYVEDLHGVQIAVEGILPEKVIRQLAEDVRKKLSGLENAECDIEIITK